MHDPVFIRFYTTTKHKLRTLRRWRLFTFEIYDPVFIWIYTITKHKLRTLQFFCAVTPWPWTLWIACLLTKLKPTDRTTFEGWLWVLQVGVQFAQTSSLNLGPFDAYWIQMFYICYLMHVSGTVRENCTEHVFCRTHFRKGLGWWAEDGIPTMRPSPPFDILLADPTWLMRTMRVRSCE
jgi:hypothetical protein